LYRQMFQYVKELLESNHGEETNIRKYPFRKRSEHIKRVFSWAEVLVYDEPDINGEAVLTAAIFHDAGYTAPCYDINHAENSVVICEKYLKEHGFEPGFTDFVVYLVKNHSNKELMREKDTPKELILLMEADLLDETGALSIVWDCMSEGNEGTQSYEKTYNRIIDYTYRTMKSNPMVTPKARAIWERKQELVEDFLRHLKYDLAPVKGERI